MLKLYSIAIILVSVQLSFSEEEPSITMEPDKSEFFPIEGDKAVYRCYAIDISKTKAPDAMFIDSNELPIKDKPGLTVVAEKNEANFTTVVTMTWDSIKMSDVTNPTHKCKATVTLTLSHVFSIIVVPKESVPTITVGPKAKISGKKGMQTSLYCNATTVINSYVKSVGIEWHFMKLYGKLPDNAQIGNTDSDKKSSSSQLIISDLAAKNVGTYFCSAILDFTANMNSDSSTFYQSLEIDEVLHEEKAENSKEEVESKYGEVAHFDCKVLGTPKAVITWYKGDEKVDVASNDRYSFYSEANEDPPNRYMSIKDVEVSDRAVYKCIAERRSNQEITKRFTLRVRDPLGALWPFIGIVIEAIVLAIIIALFELYKRKKAEKEYDVKDASPNNVKETSPLVNDDAPKVTYSGGEDGVKVRTSNNAEA